MGVNWYEHSFSTALPQNTVLNYFNPTVGFYLTNLRCTADHRVVNLILREHIWVKNVGLMGCVKLILECTTPKLNNTHWIRNWYWLIPYTWPLAASSPPEYSTSLGAFNQCGRTPASTPSSYVRVYSNQNVILICAQTPTCDQYQDRTGKPLDYVIHWIRLEICEKPFSKIHCSYYDIVHKFFSGIHSFISPIKWHHSKITREEDGF